MRTPLALWLISAALALPLVGLNPQRRLSQYAHTLWTQGNGLPQDAARVVAQTRDGFLWIGTDEGLARFDGYDFVTFTRDSGALPNNSVTALWAAPDNSLWIGTAGGLVHYQAGRFTRCDVRQGVNAVFVTSIHGDSQGTVWIAGANSLTRYRDGRFSSYGVSSGLPAQGVRVVAASEDGGVWVAGYRFLGRFVDGRYQARVLRGASFDGIAVCMQVDSAGSVLIGTTQGLLTVAPDGMVSISGEGGGLPDDFVRSLRLDSDGVLWIGTNGGLARRIGGRFQDLSGGESLQHDWVWSVFEDREKNLWVGTNTGLHQFRDPRFTLFSKTEGLPSDQPTAVAEDPRGTVWVGFHDGGLARFDGTRFLPVKDLATQEVFSLRATAAGDVLVGTRDGFVRVDAAGATTFVPSDPMGRRSVYDAIEVEPGRIWLGTTSGVVELSGGRASKPAVAGRLENESVTALCVARDGSRWAGTFSGSLLHFVASRAELFGGAQGLRGSAIRSISEGADGTLYVSTYGDGLAFRRNGRFHYVTVANGLPSNNVSYTVDDGEESLWLATTRGLARVERRQLLTLVDNPAAHLPIAVFGIGDGLRSMNCAPGWPVSSGGIRARDGRLWFPTGRGLARLRPEVSRQAPHVPHAMLLKVAVDDQSQSLDGRLSLAPDSYRVEFHYSAVQLANPNAVRYRYRLEGLDANWIEAGSRRVANYNSLPSGRYRFVVAAAGSQMSAFGPETALAFTRRPYVYETAWFRWLLAGVALGLGWLAYRYRLGLERDRFGVVLAERARISREIHDTLAQGFVGIASQLDAVAMMLPGEPERAQRFLRLAQKMANHSLTEARRSVQDLRAQALEGGSLARAVESSAGQLAAASGVELHFDIHDVPAALPHDVEQQLLRIAQESLANVLKHAAAHNVWISLAPRDSALRLAVRDDGHGFDAGDAFLTLGGHFGLLGMRERAARVHGELTLHSEPGQGTTIEVTVPLP